MTKNIYIGTSLDNSMDFIYVILVSIAVTGVIVYGIYYFTRSPRQHRTQMESYVESEVQNDEEFLEDVEEGFQGKVYSERETTQSVEPAKVYPDCFGSTDRYKSCKRDCSVSNECASTVKMLEGF
jgi:hypothetical protein